MRSTLIRAALVSCLLLATSCSTSTSAEPSGAQDEASDAPAPTADLTTSDASASVRGLRYCEVLLLDLTEEGLRAEVFNTYPLNDCPENVWASLDGGAIAADRGVPFALLNGPRFWLMDGLGRVDDGSVITTTFQGNSGEMEMNRYASVTIGTPDTVGKAYTPQSVDRRAQFTFNAGSTIFVISDVDGNRYVMQSWSQQRDPSLEIESLASLGDRLDLPEGWSYSVETLTQDLVLDSTSGPAQVFQDELMNTYSLMPE